MQQDLPDPIALAKGFLQALSCSVGELRAILVAEKLAILLFCELLYDIQLLGDALGGRDELDAGQSIAPHCQALGTPAETSRVFLKVPRNAVME